MATILMTLTEKKAPNKYEWSINFLTLGRRGKIYKYLRQKYLQEGQLLLDAGCGTGRFMEIADIAWVTSFGIDISESMLQQAQKRFGHKRQHFPLIRSSITSLPIRSEVFNVIICTLVLSELDFQNVQKALKEFNYCLKQDGFLILVTESQPTNKIKHIIVRLLRYPAFIAATLITKTPRHPIHNMTTLLSPYGPIIDQKSYLGGYLTLFVIRKKG